ncbi:hypothetical protein SSX86_032674 [Deinandra increscens subsp. villosa]|uniref:Uncharacterized protein n=1 Tax=Deinandra increscens subsp. villosa TaxID=3103831 RepID=A0AAP0C4M5_9ASTR
MPNHILVIDGDMRRVSSHSQVDFFKDATISLSQIPLKATPHHVTYFAEKNLYPLIVSVPVSRFSVPPWCFIVAFSYAFTFTFAIQLGPRVNVPQSPRWAVTGAINGNGGQTFNPSDGLPKTNAQNLKQGSSLMSMDFHPIQQTLLLVSKKPSIGDAYALIGDVSGLAEKIQRFFYPEEGALDVVPPA